MFRPRELAGIHQDAAQGVAVAAHVLRHGMNHDVEAVVDGLQERRRGHGVVHDGGNAAGAGHLRHRRDVNDVAGGVADALAEHRLGVGVDELVQVLRGVPFRETRLDTQLRQHVREQRVGAAVKLRDGDEVVPRLRQIEQGIVHRGAAGGERQGADAALELGDALLQHRLGGIHDAGVDVAGHGQVEQVGAVLGIVELVGDGLVDGHGDGMGGGVRLVAAVDGDGFVFHA